MDERLKKLYSEIDAILNLASIMGDCTDAENEMYSDMANLKESLFAVLEERGQQ